MNDITFRFLETYEYLKREGIVKNPNAFAKELNISTSMITEICKMRTNAGMTPIQNLVKRFTIIDANWLLTGEGSMLKVNNGETNTDYKELAEARKETIDSMKKEILYLEEKIEILKNKK